MPRCVVYTNPYVEAITTDEGSETLAAFQRRFAPFLFQHSTVAQEILAGARGGAGSWEFHEDWVAPFEELGRVITPSHQTWMRAALILARLVESGRMSPGGFTRSSLNDCLIAASAREDGLVLVTWNADDFEAIGRVEPGVRHEPPWPTG